MNNSRRIAIVGSGGHAGVAAAIAMASGHEVCGFYNDEQK